MSTKPTTEGILTTVSVPEAVAPAFLEAQELVDRYFSNRLEDPAQGIIEISGSRYILVRAASLSVEFQRLVTSLYRDWGEEEARKQAEAFLFDLAHSLGKSDAKALHKGIGVSDPIQKLSLGPVHFAHSGWAFVHVHPESIPIRGDDYCLVYDHPHSFEADAWLREGLTTDVPVCIMNAGYSSGWCEESFGIPLVAVEIECRAKGDSRCHFLMAPPARIQERLRDHCATHRVATRNTTVLEVPELFKRKRLEEELRDAARRFRAITESAFDPIIMMDSRGLITYWNEAAKRVFGYSCEEIMGRELHAVLAPEMHREAYERGLAHFARTGQGPAVASARELEAVRKDGTHFPVELSVSALRAGSTWSAVGIVRDISERRRMEAELVQAHKLESIGQLAAGIAHEINTPTQYIGDNATFLRDSHQDIMGLLRAYEDLLRAVKAEAGNHRPIVEAIEQTKREIDVDYLYEEIPKAITQALEGVDRVAKIVQAMREFSHPGTEDKIPIDINKAIETTITVARNEWKYVAEIETSFDPDLPLVPCLPGDFNQVILNMITNAAHAVATVVGDGSEGKGTIAIATERDGDWAVIRIRDTGSGIPEDIRHRIYDPFFTTKEVGKGTGQGLAIAYNVIVDKHGGTIALDTETGKGTTFSIRVPVDAQSEIPDEPEESFC